MSNQQGKWSVGILNNDVPFRRHPSDTPFALSLTITEDPRQINEAVYSQDVIAWSYVSQNPLLTEDHLRYLIARDNNERDRGFLIGHPIFPSDLLSELALDDPNPFILAIIADHPNATEEARISSALRIPVSSDWADFALQG